MKSNSDYVQEYFQIFNNGYSRIAMRFVFVFIFASISLAATSLHNSNVFAQSPYDSGYDHGCDDARISDPDERYINQPDKGPDFHSGKFMNGYNDGFDSCRDLNDDDNNGDTDFDRFSKAHINDQGEIETDYYITTGDRHPEDTYVHHNDDAVGIENLELERDQMPRPIDNNNDNSKDVKLEFVQCDEAPCKTPDDHLTVLLVPADWSDEEILNGILPESDSDIYDYTVLSEYCQHLDKGCSSEFDIDAYEDGTEIENGNYKIVINQGFDEEDLIYINEVEVLTAL